MESPAEAEAPPPEEEPRSGASSEEKETDKDGGGEPGEKLSGSGGVAVTELSADGEVAPEQASKAERDERHESKKPPALGDASPEDGGGEKSGVAAGGANDDEKVASGFGNDGAVDVEGTDQHDAAGNSDKLDKDGSQPAGSDQAAGGAEDDENKAAENNDGAPDSEMVDALVSKPEAASAAVGGRKSGSGRNPYLARAATRRYLRHRKEAAGASSASDLQSAVRAATLADVEVAGKSPAAVSRGGEGGDEPVKGKGTIAGLRVLLAAKDQELDAQVRYRKEAEIELAKHKKLLEKEKTKVEDILGGEKAAHRTKAAARSEIAAQKHELEIQTKIRKGLELELEKTKKLLAKEKAKWIADVKSMGKARASRSDAKAAAAARSEAAALKVELGLQAKVRKSLEADLHKHKKLLEKEKKEKKKVVDTSNQPKMSDLKKQLSEQTRAKEKAECELRYAQEWEGHLAELLEYRSEAGHCYVPASHGGGRKGTLAFWVKKLRQAKLEKEAGKREDAGLSNEQERILESIGFWDAREGKGKGGKSSKGGDGADDESFWDDFYSRLMQYRIDKGDCLVPFTYDGGLKGSLGYWVARVRRLRMDQEDGERKSEWLTDERIKLLDKLDFDWTIDGSGGGGKPRAKSALQKAEADLKEEREWNEYFARLLKYRANKGDCLVPQAQDGGRKGSLGWWVHRVRQLNQQDEDVRREKGLTDERIDMLNSVGFVFRVHGSGTSKKDLNDFSARKKAEDDLKEEKEWSDNFLELLQYRAEHGDCNVPVKHGGGKAGSLGHWVQRVRRFKQEQEAGTREQGWLSDKRVQMLDAIGFVYTAGRGKRTPELKADDVSFWNDFFSELMQYSSEKGNCNVPKNYEGELKGGLGYWVARVRKLRQEQEAGKREQGWLTDKRIEMLDGINFEWTISRASRTSEGGTMEDGTPSKKRKTAEEDEASWNDYFAKLLEYQAENGDCRVGRKYEGGKKGSLGYWVKRQRIIRQLQEAGKPVEGALTEEQIQKLDEIGFVWAGPPKAAWEDRFNELKEFKSLYGHVCPPTQPRTPLSNWVCHQRDRYKRLQSKLRYREEHGTDEGWKPEGNREISCITEEEIEKLESIGMVWSMLAAPYPGWDKQYEELVEYYNTHGHSNVPQSYKGNRNLGRWVMRQRGLYADRQKGKLSSESTMMSDERIAKLEALNFCWNRLEHTQGVKRRREIENEDDDGGEYEREYESQAVDPQPHVQPADPQHLGHQHLGSYDTVERASSVAGNIGIGPSVNATHGYASHSESTHLMARGLHSGQAHVTNHSQLLGTQQHLGSQQHLVPQEHLGSQQQLGSQSLGAQQLGSQSLDSQQQLGSQQLGSQRLGSQHGFVHQGYGGNAYM